jgi:hypothetical protein
MVLSDSMTAVARISLSADVVDFLLDCELVNAGERPTEEKTDSAVQNHEGIAIRAQCPSESHKTAAVIASAMHRLELFR